MISLFLPAPIVAVLVFVALIAGTMAAATALLPFALAKLLLPFEAARRAGFATVPVVTHTWVVYNSLVYRLFYPNAWDIELQPDLKPSKSYLLISNHQSWIDILLLVHVFHMRAPFPRFFLKKQLLWVPFIGWGCWALEMPFMKRHSRKAIEENPALRNEDLETTRASCQKFRGYPVTLVNFVEGTRGNEAKRVASGSPYRHLLRPKSAGLSFALNTMGDQFGGVIDLTIAYRPTRYPIVWSFLIGEQTQLSIRADVLPVPAALIRGDYHNDAEYRTRFQSWLNGIWTRKDARLDRLINEGDSPVRARTT